MLVQTASPEASVIAHAARHDSAGFLAEELMRREALRYPPFADLVRVVCSAADRTAARAAAGEVAELIRAAADDVGAELLGPAPLFRLRGRDRFQLVVKARERAPAVRAVGEAVEAVSGRRAHRLVAFSVDVDPQ